MSNEKPFLQSWLGGTFSHVEGDLEFSNSDGSASITTGDYGDIVQFIHDNDDFATFADLIVGDQIAGFSLQFPADEPAACVPSFSISGHDFRWDVYLVDGPTQDIRTLIADLQPIENDQHVVENLIPLPINDYDMPDADADRATEGYRVYTVAELQNLFFPEELVEPTWWNQAEVFGTLDPAILAKPMVIAYGKNSFAKEWDTKPEMTLEVLLDKLLTRHTTGPKDGFAFVTGGLGKSRRRTKTNVLANYLIGLDVDSGAHLLETFEKVQKLGLMAIFYTTHSHGTTIIEVSHDKYYRWAAKHELEGDPTVEDMKIYLHEDGKYTSDVVDGVSSVVKDHDGTMRYLCQTRPIDKFRIIFPLDEPYVYANEPGAHKDVIARWERKVLGMGRALNIEVDRVARDPSRLFYLPRHSKGANNYRVLITPGRLLTFEEVKEESTSTRVSDDPFDQAAHILGGTARGRVLSPELGVDLQTWARDRANGFDIASLFRDHCSDRIRTEQTVDKLTVECPFDEEHSNPGDADDQGTFIQSAGMEAETFAFFCSHAGCHGRDRLAMLQKAMQSEWFSDADFLSEGYYDAANDDSPKSDDDVDGDDEGADDKDYSAKYAEAVQAVSGIAKDAKRIKIDEVYHIVAGIARREDRASLITTLAKKLDLLKPDVLAHINRIRKSGGVVIEDDTPEPEDIVKQLRRTHQRYKGKKNIRICPVIEANIKGSTDYFVDNLNSLNGEEPSLYSFGSNKIRCVRSANDEWLVEALSKPIVKSIAQTGMDIIKVSSDGGLNFINLPDEIADQAVVSPGLALHKLEGFSELPYFTREGKLVTSAGYDRDGMRLLKLHVTYDEGGNEIPNPYAPDCLHEITDENLAIAKDEIMGLFTDFPFKDHPDDQDDGVGARANLLAMMLQPLVRSMFDGNTPFYLIDKPTAGTGATLLVTTAMRIATGVMPGTVAMSGNDEELRKSITARMTSTSTNVIFFDNLIEPLNSPHLANLATSTEWEDRILGQSTMTKIPNRVQVIVAGNNVRTSDENTRRVLPIKMDFEDDPTDTSRVFQIPDLKGYVEENRERLFKHLILMVQYWLKNREIGWEPKQWIGFTLPSFEQYCAVMGSLLDTIGVQGFGSNVKYVKSDNSDKQAWANFVTLLAEKNRSAKGPHEFENSTHFMLREAADIYANWKDKEALQINGARYGVRVSDDDAQIQQDLTRSMKVMDRQVFKIMWESSENSYEEIKVRLVREMDAKKITRWVIRRVHEKKQAA